MWRTLSNEAREAIGRLCEQHGGHLYDYCRTGLSASDAELAVAGALLSAHVHRDRLRDPELLRPWLYALARCHRASVAAMRPASTGSWTRPGAPDLVADALRALDAPHRELLDLSVRHELPSAGIAAIFDVEAIQVNTMIAEAADRLEEWIAAVRAARTRGGCPKLAVRVTDWAKAPGRRTRSRIARHIRTCQACRTVPRDEVRAGVLLLELVPAPMPDTLREQPAWGDPLPSDPAAWRADGFPVQARGLLEPPPALISLVPGPTTETRAPSWPVAGAAATGQEPSGPPGPEEPERPRRGPAAPPGTAEALLRALHPPGERLMTAGQAESSGDTIPYRKRGDFPPLRIPAQRRDPAQEDTAPRTAPPHWGVAGRRVREKGEDRNGEHPSGPRAWHAPAPRPDTSAPSRGTPRTDGPAPRTDAPAPRTGGTGHQDRDDGRPGTRPARSEERDSGRAIPDGGWPQVREDGWDGEHPGHDEGERRAWLDTPPERGDERDGEHAAPDGGGHRAWPHERGDRRDGCEAPGGYERGAWPGVPHERGDGWGGLDGIHVPAPRRSDDPPRRGENPPRRGEDPPRRGDDLPHWGDEPPHWDDEPPHWGDEPPRQHAPLRTLDPGRRSGRSPSAQYGDKLVFSALVTAPPPARDGRDGRDGGDGTEEWDEFWRNRPDEDDPEARISLQWLVRAALIVGVVMLVAGLVWAGVRQRQTPPAPTPATGAPAGTGASQAPADPGTGSAPADGANVPADPGASGAPVGPGASRSPAGPSQADGAEHGSAHPWTSPVPADGASQPSASQPSAVPKPAPAPPVARIVPASVHLGERRSGTFKLICTGDCRVTSFSGSNGIEVSGNRFKVRVPAGRPGCAGPPVTESGVITVNWAGTTTGDGTTTEGTATADGTLTLMVSWTVTNDRGAFIPDTNGGGHWSNCPRD